MTDARRGVMATEVVAIGAIDVESIQLRQRILRPPGDGEALVAITASGVPPIEPSTGHVHPRHEPQSYVPGCDLVGTVHSVGPNVNPVLIGRQVAALTKTGGWATYALISATALIPALDMLEPAAVETLLVEGVAARQMLHRHAHVRPFATVLIHVGRNHGIARMLAQLATRQNVRVIIAAKLDRLKTLTGSDAELVDVDAPDFAAQIGVLAPTGLQAAFVHQDDIGAFPSLQHLFAPGGSVVSFTTSTDQQKSAHRTSTPIKLMSKDRGSNRPGARQSSSFYNIWTGYRPGAGSFRDHLREDLTYVLDLLATNAIDAPVAARLPLNRITQAIQLARSPETVGRVVLTPSAKPNPSGATDRFTRFG